MAEYKLKENEVNEAVQLIRNLVDDWSEVYEKFADYRLMAAGELSKKHTERLKEPQYEYRSKLKPRLIADAIKDLRSYTGYTIFHNSDGAYNFIPVDDENDIGRAKKATDLVDHCWDRTNTKRVCKEVIEDIAQVGTGYSMINQWIDRRYTPRQVEKFKILYQGPRLVRLKPELVYPQKVKEWDKVGAIARKFTVPHSKLLYESARGGLTSEYAEQVKALKPKEFDEPDELFEIHKDNEESMVRPRVKDFPVLCAELWQNCMYGDDEYPTWYRIVIADFDLGGGNKPIIVNFDRDPMQTGMHNIIHSTIFPAPDRLNGYGVPEMLAGLNLEMFHKRNQVIDYINLIMAVHGTIWGDPNAAPNDDITVQTGRFKTLKAGRAKDLHTITLDVSAVSAAHGEIGRIDQDVQKTIGSNEITSGRTPVRREAATIGALIDENAKMRQTDPIEEIEETLIKPVAMGYLAQVQAFMTSPMRVRVLGQKAAFEWELVSLEDIQGHFDIQCVASSQIMPRAMKQANMNAFLQTFGNNPYIAPKLDWIELYKDVCDILEWPKAKKYIKDPSKTQEDIQREEQFMLETGLPWIVNSSDDHVEHISSHMQNIAQTPNGKMHIFEHNQKIQMQQGQSAGGQESAAYTNQGEMLNDMSANSSAKATGR